jgi:membrane-associated protease RseP (regulator of RpoE activity)
LLLALVVSGCATAPKPEEPTPEPVVETPADPWRFEPDGALTDEAIQTLRATPAPTAPVVITPENPAAEDLMLRSQGYLRIGDGYFVPGDAEFDAHVLALGTRIAADIAVVAKAPAAAAPAPATEPTVAVEQAVTYYVRFRPPFGAGFRDLDPAELAAIGKTGGVRIISVIGASPAADANVREGDIVLSIDGVDIADATAFKQRLRERAGKPVTLLLLRGSERVRRQIQLGVLPPQPPPQPSE